MTLGPKPRRVGSRSRTPRGVERQGRAACRVDHREEVAAHPAQVLRGDGEDSAGGDGRVGRRPPGPEHGSAGAGCQMVDGADHASARPQRGDRGDLRHGGSIGLPRRATPARDLLDFISAGVDPRTGMMHIACTNDNNTHEIDSAIQVGGPSVLAR